MNRQIKFRGKNIHTGQWLYGNYHCEGKTHYITKPDQFRDYAPMQFIVDEKTVGQFTGLLDKNGEEIFEGDIVNLYFNYRGKNKRKTPKVEQGVIGWSLCGLRIKIMDYPGAPWNHMLIQYGKQIEVIGNIHYNPELRQTQYNDTTTIH